jgi:pimeloyl-ACP methyl ester carboxylesterase
MTRGQYLASLAALLRFDVGERLAEIRCPTLIVAGARDATVPLAAKEAIATTIPHARLALLEDSGHVSPHDDPGGFNRLLLDHLHRASA